MASAGLPRAHSSFVGRRRDLERLRDLLARRRLVTISGPPGIGKTRLALHLARELADRSADGVAFLDLASLPNAHGLTAFVAQRLGLKLSDGDNPDDALCLALESRQLLLVMDNCEHVIDAASRLISRLMDRCEQVRIIATSRERLRLPGEALFRVAPLQIDAGHQTAPAGLRAIESIVLFAERAQEAQPDFTLTDHNIADVQEICRRLEGMPLAIELAAGLASFLSPSQILAGLDHALGLLVRGSRLATRHGSLRAALDWSYSLLDEAQKELLQSLSVIAGSFDVGAARAVSNGSDAVDPVLFDLVEKSLVQVVSQGTVTRFRLLEPVRQYAAERLEQGAGDYAPRRRLLLHFLALAEAFEPALMSGNRDAAIEVLEADRHNLLEALAWSLRAEADDEIHEAGSRLAAMLFWYWNVAGSAYEGLRWLRLANSYAALIPRETRARVLYAGGELAWLFGEEGTGREWLRASAEIWRSVGDGRRVAYCLQALSFLEEPETGHQLADEALALFDAAGDRWGGALALHTKGMIESQRGAPAAGRDLLNRALGLYQELGEAWLSIQALNNLGDLERNEGRYEVARAHYETGLSLVKQSHYRHVDASLVQNLGFVWLHLDNAPAAAARFREAINLFVYQADRRGIAESMAGLAGVLSAAQAETAARLLGVSARLLEEANATQWRSNRDDLTRTVAELQGTLGANRFESEVEAGRSLSLTEALREAHRSTTEAPQSRNAAAPHLTRREIEVATLVARGFTNRQIAAELVISAGTAGLHVKHILRRLEFSSRSQVAAWAVAHGLLAPGTQTQP